MPECYKLVDIVTTGENVRKGGRPYEEGKGWL